MLSKGAAVSRWDHLRKVLTPTQLAVKFKVRTS